VVRLIVGSAYGFGFCHIFMEEDILEVVVVDLHLGKFLLDLFILEEDLLERPEPDAEGWNSLSDFGVEKGPGFVFSGLNVSHSSNGYNVTTHVYHSLCHAFKAFTSRSKFATTCNCPSTLIPPSYSSSFIVVYSFFPQQLEKLRVFEYLLMSVSRPFCYFRVNSHSIGSETAIFGSPLAIARILLTSFIKFCSCTKQY
jgi:hypothetical protein